MLSLTITPPLVPGVVTTTTTPCGLVLGKTEDEWISDWAPLIQRYRHIPQVVGADLRNEVRAGPIGGRGTTSIGLGLAEAAGNHLLSLNSDLLIVVEGINYAADLRQVTTRPIDLSRP